MVVGDENSGNIEFLLDLPDLLANAHPQGRIEVAERFIKEQHLRPDNKSPGKGHPLQLAAAQLAGHSVAVASKPHQFEDLIDAPIPLRVLHLAELEPVGHVRRDRHGGKHRVVLEHNPNVPLLRGDIVH